MRPPARPRAAAREIQASGRRRWRPPAAGARRWAAGGAVAAAAAAAVSLGAQAPQAPVFRAGVELIPVDVTVTDARGRQVTDLSPAEFLVEVDGRPRRVVSAEYVSLVDAAAGPEPREAPPSYFSSNVAAQQRGRLILLLIDQGNIRVGAARSIMTSALRFIDRLSPLDRIAVAAVPTPGVMVDFTTDHAKAREGLLRVAGQLAPYRKRFHISLTEAMAVTQNRDPRILQALYVRECGVYAGTTELERCERELEQEAFEVMFHQRQVTSNSLRGMREVLAALRAIDAPKSVILISEGLVLDGLGGEVDDIAAVAADARASLDVLLLDVPRIDVTQAELPSTPREDRELQELGLEMLAGMARGGLYRVTGSADFAFERIHQAMAGYYLLGLESLPGDREGRRHQIRVRTTRRGLTVQARRAFLAPGGRARLAPAEAVARALRSPSTATDLPLRLTAWTYKELGSPRVRVLVAADIQRTTDQPLEYATGLTVVESATGRVVTAATDTGPLAVDPGDAGLAVYTGTIVLDPGVYRVRFAAADAEGRVGSVEREVHAWHLDDDTPAVGDLTLAAAPGDGGGTLRPSIEPLVHNHQLVAVAEVYGRADERLDHVHARLEILRDEIGPPLSVVPMRMGFGDSPEVRTLQAVLDTSVLPAGRYLARLVVHEGNLPRGDIVRPFRVAPRAAGAPAPRAAGAASEVLSEIALGVPEFRRDDVLAPPVLAAVWRLAGEGRPAPVRDAVQQAAGGQMRPAALAAFEAGDQMVAAFVRGVELFAQDRIAQATVQLHNAMSMAPSFAPARLFLGACLAAADRHREAASLLTSVPADALGVPAVARLAGEAWLRAGEPLQAIEPLERAAAAGDAAAARALGLAYALVDRPADAVPVLAGYLDRHPDDQRALLAALYATYAAHAASTAPAARLTDDRARARQWARAYRAAGGPLASLVDAWLSYLDGLP